MSDPTPSTTANKTPRRGPAIAMALGVIGALVLAVAFPFAVAAEPGSSTVGFGGGDDSVTAFLGLDVAPATDLGFRYCIRSSEDPSDSDKWTNDAITACAFSE